jgi:hypothetical protein
MMGAVGIEPRVQFQAARVRLGDPESQRIVVGLGGLALFAAEKIRPRFNAASVECIGLGTHLKHHGVESHVHGRIENGNGFCLLRFAVEARFGGPVDIGDSGYPDGAELAFNRRYVGVFIHCSGRQ